MNLDNHNTDTEISIKDFYFLLRKYIKLILVVSISIFTISIIYTLNQTFIYESTAVVLIEEQSSSMNIFDAGFLSKKNFIENEIEILKSRTASHNTLNDLIKSEHKDNLYLLNTRKLNKNFIEKIFGSIMNTDHKDFFDYEVNDSLLNIYVKKLRSQTKIFQREDTDMISISVRSPDPYESALISNTIVDAYRKMDLKWVTGEMSHLKTFLSEQISKKEFDLEKAENALKNFQEQKKIFGVKDNSELLLNNLINSESELFKVKAENNIAQERLNYYESTLTIEEKKLVENVAFTIDSRLSALKQEIALKESELISTISQQGENHPIVDKLQIKINKLKKNLENETRDLIDNGISVSDPIKYRQALMDSVIKISAQSAMLKSKVDEFQKLVLHYEKKLSVLPKQVLEFTNLSRNVNIHNQTYSLMREKLEEAKINEASKIGKVRVVDYARPNLLKVKPSRKLNAILGLIFGLAIAFSIAFLIEYFDNTIKSIEDIEKLGIPILAIIPSIKSSANKNRKTKKYQKKIGNVEHIQRRMITREDPKSPISEAYRGLRTSLMYSNKKDETPIILVSSTGPGEGKTTTIVNLAMTYANLGKKTILLDTDLRKPVGHKIFSMDREPGITKFISNQENDISKIIRSTDVENLDLITCGVIPPNPSEMLESKNMEKIIKKLKQTYDIILMDSPPLLAVTDSFVSMKYVNQFILIVRAGKTEKSGFLRSLDLINQSNAPFHGIVMNAVDESSSYGRGYYYNYYQYYYGDDK